MESTGWSNAKLSLSYMFTIEENCGDIYADAKDINEKRDAKEAVIEDECDCGCETVTEEA